MNRFILSICVLIGIIASLSVFAEPQPLQLSDYLDQVTKNSPAVKASHLIIEGAKQSAVESPYSPKLSFTGSLIDDKRESSSVFLLGTTSKGSNYNLAIDQQFSTGTTAKLSYNIDNSEMNGLSSSFSPTGSFKYSNAQTQLDLAQPLWKNFFGVETRASADLLEASSLATHYAEKFKLKQTISQAESAYYRLAIAREALKLQEEVLDRSKKILEWSDRRVKNQIADKSDMLQAKAAYQARQLEIETVKGEARSAQIAFNTLRNSTDEVVKEELAPMNTDAILQITIPKRASTSDDVKAAEQNERVVAANNEIGRQRAMPELSLFGTLAYNGVDFNSLSPAVSESFTTKHPMYKVGVRFSMPLFFLDAAEVRSGRVKQQLAAEAVTQQARLNSNQNLDDLEKKFAEAKDRLKLADELVKAQKEKLDHEKYRLNLGRTTTFQVLTYEQDYAQAVIMRLHIEQEMIAIHAQLKTYSEE